jgi:hypothetical protein
MNQACNKRAIHIVHEWQQLAFVFQFEIGVSVQKPFHDFTVFLRLQAARAVNQNPAGFHPWRGSF